MFFYNSGFAADIVGMMEWRATLGYCKESYDIELKDLDEYCLDRFPQATVLTKEIAIGFLDKIRERRKGHVDAAAIRCLAKYQIMLGKSSFLLPSGIYSYSKPRLPRIMTEDECSRFFEATDQWPHQPASPLLEYTVPVIFRLQYATGMRPQEVRKLSRNDFDFIHNTVYIAESKRHKDRLIPVDADVMRMCKKYDAISREMYPNTPHFFPNKLQNVHAAESLFLLFRKCWEMAGNHLDQCYCSPYILRHNFATQTIMRWVEEGADLDAKIPYLSAYMGHETFESTYYYIHLLPERLSRMKFMDISDITGSGGVL